MPRGGRDNPLKFVLHQGHSLFKMDYMDEKSNLYVFERKEVFLIFVFMILIGITSFILGVKVGKQYSFAKAGFEESDRNTVDMLSKQEEQIHDGDRPTDVQLDTQDLREKMNEKLEKKIREELEREPAPVEKKPQVESIQTEAPVKPQMESDVKDGMSGKYTIQLGSYKNLEDAEQFANGFKIKGYNPIISQKDISGRGTWYRVSLGAFESLSEAKDYILKEKELFMGQDYVFGQLD